MKQLVAILTLATLVCSCNNTNKTSAEIDKNNIEISDNPELKQLYEADQGDRRGSDKNWAEISERDKLRQQRVKELLDSGKVQTSNDYANAAMVFQHGSDTIASGLAVSLMRKAVELDTTRSKWLLAAAIDRDLMRKKKPQIFGTQYFKAGPNAPWTLYDLDTNAISDEERMKYDAPILAKQYAQIKRMNLRKLIQLEDSIKIVSEIIELIRNEALVDEYDVSEGGINQWGYELMQDNRIDEALQVFKLNTQLFPNGYNTFDSYGECLLKLGNKEEAKLAYKKSLELNPKNKNAEEVLEGMDK